MREGGERVISREVEAAVTAARGGVVKVILETGYLDDQQKVRAAQLAAEGGAAFVKTSTRPGPRGAGGGGGPPAASGRWRPPGGSWLRRPAGCGPRGP